MIAGALIHLLYIWLILAGYSLYTEPTTACGDGYYNAMPKYIPASDTLSPEECYKIADLGSIYLHTFKNRLAYDTLRYYVEHCYTEFNIIYEFSNVTSGCSGVVQDEKIHEWPHYRDWLLSVLYLRTDSLYYCADVREIALASMYLDSGLVDARAAISVLKYLIDSIGCGHMRTGLEKEIVEGNWTIVTFWRDTVKDSSTSSPDTTTIYTLDELGLQLLRNFKSDVEERDILAAGLIGELTVKPNPARSETQLQFSLTDPAVLRLDIFDALGRSMYSKPLGWQSSGEHTIDINLHTWAEGVYYARLSTLRGEVKTVKLHLQR